MKKLLGIFITSLLCASLALGADETTEETTSALQNAAQTQKAENLAVASQEAAQQKAQTDVATAESSLAQAQQTLDSALAANTANPTETTAAQVAQAEADLAAAQQALDTATGALATASGVSQADIDGMRASGMGWGEIAHELGVHPSVLGLGKTKAKEERTRSTKGLDTAETSSKGGGKALGLAGKAEKGNTSGKGSNSGNGKGGNNGGGNGNGGGKK